MWGASQQIFMQLIGFKNLSCLVLPGITLVDVMIHGLIQPFQTEKGCRAVIVI